MTVSRYGLGDDMDAYLRGFGLRIGAAGRAVLNNAFQIIVISVWEQLPCTGGTKALKGPCSQTDAPGDAAPFTRGAKAFCPKNKSFFGMLSAPTSFLARVSISLPGGAAEVGIEMRGMADLVGNSDLERPSITRNELCPTVCEAGWVQATARGELEITVRASGEAGARLQQGGLPLVAVGSRFELAYITERYTVRHYPDRAERIDD